jgi:hypothetical protein
MSRRFNKFLILGSAALVLIAVSVLQAQTTRIALEPLASGLAQPVLLTSAKDGTNRRFIIEQLGRVRVLQPGATASTVFLDIAGRVRFDGEQGLLGLAFHPQFSTNRRFYLNYTRQPDGATVVAEYRASAANPNVAETAETVLVTISQPFANHNGGMIEFGPDGHLYIGMGDGGSANDPGNRAQNPQDLLGKMLRMDVDGARRAEIFASGFRNPWRFSFDRITGLLYAGDVGQNAREEIDIVYAGGNYGWRVFEGTRCTNLGPASCTASNYIPPITEYTNTGSAGRCSVIGGYVYRGSQGSLPYGAYIYGDLCSGEIFMFNDGAATVLLDTALQISSFGEDESGELYVVGVSGSISRLTNPDVTIASSRTFSVADRAGFSTATTGSAAALTVGYARIQADQGRALPSGIAIFGYRPGGVTVSEASIPASPLITSGRVFAEVGSNVNTGIAIANPNSVAVAVSFFFTDSNGNNFGQGATTIPANQQVAAFLNESPFNGGDSLQGTFTFSSSAPVSAIALRGLTNERNEFLITTLPVADLVLTVGTVTIPHFADGGGWTTQVVLVNPLEGSMTGTVEFVGTNGEITRFTSYTIAPRSSTRIATVRFGTGLQVGSVRVSPAGGGAAPSAFTIFSFRSNDITVTEAGVPALPAGTSFRSYVERSGGVQTGLAIANPTSTAVSVMLSLTDLNGSALAGGSTTLNIPANGQRAFFLGEIPQFATLSTPFQGFLRITAATPIAVTSLRSRINERQDFLITTTTPVDESQPPTSSELLFPHWAEGGGYHMQFILFGREASGTIYFFDRGGQPVNLMFR